MKTGPLVLLLAAPWPLAACGESGPPGTYEASAESLLRAFTDPDWLRHEDPEAREFAKARLLENAGDSQAAWRARLRLAPDGSFELTMHLPLSPASTSRGTWHRDGDGLELEVTHRGGEALAEPEPMAARIEDGAVILGDGTTTPRFRFERIE